MVSFQKRIAHLSPLLVQILIDVYRKKNLVKDENQPAKRSISDIVVVSSYLFLERKWGNSYFKTKTRNAHSLTEDLILGLCFAQFTYFYLIIFKVWGGVSAETAGVTSFKLITLSKLFQTVVGL